MLIKTRWVLHKSMGHGKQLGCHWLVELFHCRGGVPDYLLYYIVHQIYCNPSTWSTYTKLITHETLCPCSYVSHVHVYLPYACMFMPMYTSIHSPPTPPCLMEQFKEKRNDVSFLFDYIVLSCHIPYTMSPPWLHACHLSHVSPTLSTFCACSPPNFSHLFPSLFCPILVFGGNL